MRNPQRTPLLLLAVCVFFAICTEMLPVGLLPQISDGLDVSPSATGVLISLYAILVAVMSVPLTALANRWPRRQVLTALLAAYALSNVIFAVSPDYAVAIVARIIGGLAHAGFFAVAVGAAVSLVDAARSGRAVTIVMIGNALAVLLGVPLGTALGTLVGWRWAFAVLAIAVGVLAVAVRRVLPAQPASASTAGTSVLEAVRRPSVLIMAGTIMLLTLGHFTLYTYISPLLLHDGFAGTQVSVLLFAYGCGGLLGIAAAGAVVVRRPVAALAVDIIVMGTSLGLAAAATSTAGIVAVIVLWGIAFGAFPTLTQTVMLQAAGEATDAGAALVNATTNVGIAGGALIGARLLGVIAVPALGWVGAGFVALSLVTYAVKLRWGGPAASEHAAE